MYEVKRQMEQTKISVFISGTADKIVTEAANSFSETVRNVLKFSVSIEPFERFSWRANAFVFSTFDEFDKISSVFEEEKNKCLNEGFAVTKKEGVIFVLSHLSKGVYYGVHELLERNLPVVFSRGAKEEAVQYLEIRECDWSAHEFIQNCPFAVRSWNICGTGSDGKGHLDDGTAEHFARNKANAVFHTIDESWRKYGLFQNGKRVSNVQVFDEVANVYPEYFMTEADGTPKKAFGGYESFPNYYNKDVAKFLARRLVEGMEKTNEEDIFHWTMPDNSYFYMQENGVKLHEQPFTCDDGTVVYPNESNYKSTVYFNFLNRLICEINKETERISYRCSRA